MRAFLVVAAMAALPFGCSSGDADEQPTPGDDVGQGGQGGDEPGATEIPEGCTTLVTPSDDDHAEVLGALLEAEEGDVVCFGEGRYRFADEVSVDVAKLTLRGVGAAILDFTDQKNGGNGLHVTSNDVLIESLRIENPPGNGIRATAVDGITIRDVEVEWTWGPKTENGGYGIYPVQSSRVLIEGCFVSGASDTGIYVGQSTQIIVRHNRATKNVAGIEIENSTDADVYENHTYGNTSGILVFNLPGLAVKDGKRAKVHHNLIEDNNLPNFAAEGNIVAMVPQGTGVLVIASDDNEIHDNTITKHQSLGVAIVNYGMAQRKTDDAEFDFYPEGNYVHDNVFSEIGYEPEGEAKIIAVLASLTTMPELVFDGLIDKEKEDDGSLTNCFADNGDAGFLDLYTKSTDIAPYSCSYPSLPAIEL